MTFFFGQADSELHQSTQQKYGRGERKRIHCGSGHTVLIPGNDTWFADNSDKCRAYMKLSERVSLSQYKHEISELIFSLHCNLSHLSLECEYNVHGTYEFFL